MIMYGPNLMTMLMHEMEDTNPVLEVLLNFSGIPSIREKGSQRLDFKTVQRQQLSIVSNRKQDRNYILAFFNAADSLRGVVILRSP